MAMCENWQVFVHNGRHNHAIGVYTHGHAQVAKLTKEQLIQIEQFRKSHEYLRKLGALKTKWKSRPDFLHYLFNNWLNPFAHKFVRCWTKSHMHFGVETTNRVESGHSVLKLWLSTCHGDLDTVFLNIDSLIEGQIADIKASLEFSKTKEKHNAKSNHIFYIVCIKISHLVLKKIWSEITRAAEIYDDPKNKCGHYLRTSHGLPCACELITQFDHVLPIQLHDINAFWKILEIGGPHPLARQ
ncbi:hypothetical protein M9H77_18723 [Catharanthus roseus]|uniref:Uncharacterized protein n=1 Tax=Catharanthus roseus TaxID=4058 RepID=A0ACC0B894_CATRO|nr:hypothetical protein M9H77_18723 [Catharanthus roseus]